MEVLLAALIVGVIGIALAALTTAAVREGGVGRTRVMLRHQLSLAMQQLRQDKNTCRFNSVRKIQTLQRLRSYCGNRFGFG